VSEALTGTYTETFAEDALRTAKLVYGVDVAPALHFVDEAADDSFVLFRRHVYPPASVRYLYRHDATQR
jgi:hypothetical protein